MALNLQISAEVGLPRSGLLVLNLCLIRSGVRLRVCRCDSPRWSVLPANFLTRCLAGCRLRSPSARTPAAEQWHECILPVFAVDCVRTKSCLYVSITLYMLCCGGGDQNPFVNAEMCCGVKAGWNPELQRPCRESR